MRVQGQAEYMQLEQSTPGTIVGTQAGRVYADITTPSALIPKFYDGSGWRGFLTLGTNDQMGAFTVLGNMGTSSVRPSALRPSEYKNSIFYAPFAITITATGAGSFNLIYAFLIVSGNCTLGATYTNNGITFTVLNTVAAGTIVYMQGSGPPTSTGTLTKSGGTGDTTLTFLDAQAPLYLRVEGVGAGAGGCGSGSASAGVGTAGGNTTVNTTSCVGNGAAAPGAVATGGTGGAASLGTGVWGKTQNGNSGDNPCGSMGATASTALYGGGKGGASYFGGAVRMVSISVGLSPVANSGSGGGGAACPASINNANGGGGGGAGGYFDAILSRSFIASIGAAIPYSVGAKGTGGTAGTSGSAGGDAADGKLIFWAHFQ